MKIESIRLNPATNSSSTHSVIIFNDVDDIPSDDDGVVVLSHKTDKMQWLAYNVFEELKNNFSNEEAKKIVNEIFGDDIVFTNDDTECDNVDIYEGLRLPTNYQHLINKEFLEELKEDMSQDNVAVVSAHDGSDAYDEAFEKGEELIWFTALGDSYYGTYAITNNDECWTLFNKRNGSKITFSLDDVNYKQSKPKVPELVDIKITDKCIFGCEFCYQDSTVKGTHGEAKEVKALLQSLAELGTFEVVLGGGEPTLHPDFFEIIKFGHDLGLVVNFTTRSLTWLPDLNEFLIKNKSDYPVNFAFSVQTPNDIKLLNIAMGKGRVSRQNLNPSVHIVMGISDRDNFSWMIKESVSNNFPITLLGYKSVGRGFNKNIINYDWWIDVVQSVTNSRISIDTSLAKAYANELHTAGINPILYDIEEGFTSCYVDTVVRGIGRHSFGVPLVPIDCSDKKAIVREFAKW